MPASARMASSSTGLPPLRSSSTKARRAAGKPFQSSSASRRVRSSRLSDEGGPVSIRNSGTSRADARALRSLNARSALGAKVVNIVFGVIVLCAAGTVAAEERASPGREEARKVLQARGCGSCHNTAVSTENPKALAVYDLHEADWAGRMSDERLPKLLGRLRSAPATDRKIVKRFIEAELAVRADLAK